MVNRGQRLYRRFRAFFSKMERGRILLLGIIACVMLCQRVYGRLSILIFPWYYPDADLIDTFIDIIPELVVYTTALILVLYVIFSVRRKMSENGVTMTLEHLKELAFIALALAIFLLPSTVIWVSWAVGDYIDPDPWDMDINRAQRHYGAIGTVTVLTAYCMIAILSWKAYKRGSAQTTYRLSRGRVIAMTLIALIMVSSDSIYWFGWVRYNQIYSRYFESGWEWLYQSPYWFYYSVLLSCAIGALLIHTWFRMRTEKLSMSRGQLQELAVISIGLWLLFLPIFIDQSIYFIDRYVLDDPPDLDDTHFHARETQSFYYRLSLLFTFCAYLTVGLLAMRRHKRTLPIDVVPMEGPALPPQIDTPEDHSLHED